VVCLFLGLADEVLKRLGMIAREVVLLVREEARTLVSWVQAPGAGSGLHTILALCQLVVATFHAYSAQIVKLEVPESFLRERPCMAGESICFLSA
jgi:hypothetical protein